VPWLSSLKPALSMIGRIWLLVLVGTATAFVPTVGRGGAATSRPWDDPLSRNERYAGILSSGSAAWDLA
jgi:hypothetical protein